MRTTIEQLRTQAAHIPRALHLVWHATRIWTAIWLGLLALQGLLPAAIVTLTRLLVDNLTLLVGAGLTETSVRQIAVLGVLMGAALVLTEFLDSAINWIATIQAELVQDHIAALVYTKSTEVDLAFYDSAEYYDHLHRARSEAAERPLELLDSIGGLLRDGITLVALAALLIPYGPWLPLVLLLSTLPALYVVLRHQRRYHQWWQHTTADQRRAEYYHEMLTESAIAPEVRLFGLGTPFRAAYLEVRHRLRQAQFRLTRDQSIAQLGASTFAILATGAVMVWMIGRTLEGAVTLGVLVLFYQAFSQGQGMLRSLLGNMGQIYSGSLFLGNLFAFLDLKPQVMEPPAPQPLPTPLQHGFRFRDVTFCYPDSERAALQQFNLEIPAGQVVAIVGANGAGKSTLLKLICRFYDPQAGAVELDHIDLRQFALADLRRAITVLFQLPVRYQATAGDNIGLGDLAATPDSAVIEAAAHGAGAHDLIMRLPHGYATQLGKWFAEGTELSGGEWQRVALARAFLRKAQIVVLDEPTSFMDSWAETEWMQRFRDLVQGRTALMITHRFTTAMQADIIHVMDQGMIVESGTHTELLAHNGLYARSWHSQMAAANGQSGTRPSESLVAASIV